MLIRHLINGHLKLHIFFSKKLVFLLCFPSELRATLSFQCSCQPAQVFLNSTIFAILYVQATTKSCWRQQVSHVCVKNPGAFTISTAHNVIISCCFPISSRGLFISLSNEQLKWKILNWNSTIFFISANHLMASQLAQSQNQCLSVAHRPFITWSSLWGYVKFPFFLTKKIKKRSQRDNPVIKVIK